jgi:Ser/Thr protein kinase RdoA (MazF antagonist)
MNGNPLKAWQGLEITGKLAGGARNEVLAARRGTAHLVVRRSSRPAPALEWELDLTEHLAEHGVGVPRTVRSDGGLRHVNGLVVQAFIPGRPPRDSRDWCRVVEAAERVHDLTWDWPQRPGFASARDLQVSFRGGDVALDRMPAEDAVLIRAAWEPVLTRRLCAIHGDLGGGNVLITAAGAALLDWDESRVDVPWFDFAHLPLDVEVPSPVSREQLLLAGVAWETATCWVPEPEYAARRLAELRDLIGAAGDPDSP